MRTAPAPRASLVRLFLCLSLLAQGLLPSPAGASAGRNMVKSRSSADRAAVRQDTEAAGLPDLDEARRRPHHEPKAVPPVPSKRRRCPPRNPRCNDDVDGRPQATPTPGRPPHNTPHASADTVPSPAGAEGNPHALAYTVAPSLSSLLRSVGGVLPMLDPLLLDFYTRDGGYSVSDSSPTGPLATARAVNVHGAGAAFAAAPVQSSGLVGFWKFDEVIGSAAADSSGMAGAGTLQNGAAWGSGMVGGAVSFDGVDDYVQVGSNSALGVNSGLTVSAWLYPTGAGSGGALGGIIVNKEGEYEIARFQDGTIQWAVANTSPGWDWVNTGFVAPLNQWTHITFTYDGAAGKLYANGQLMHTRAATGLIGDVDPVRHDFRIGGRQGLSQHFAGRLDEVRFYGRALSQSEVSSLLTSGAAYSGTPLTVPGNVEAEHFDNGGQGVGYFDTTTGSHGQDYTQPPSYPPPAFRQPTDVDIYKAPGYSGDYLVVMQAED